MAKAVNLFPGGLKDRSVRAPFVRHRPSPPPRSVTARVSPRAPQLFVQDTRGRRHRGRHGGAGRIAPRHRVRDFVREIVTGHQYPFQRLKPVAGMIHAGILQATLLVAAPLAGAIPMTVRAAILFVLSYNRGEWREIPELWRQDWTDWLVWLGPFSLTVLADLTVAVEAGRIRSWRPCSSSAAWRRQQPCRERPATTSSAAVHTRYRAG